MVFSMGTVLCSEIKNCYLSSLKNHWPSVIGATCVHKRDACIRKFVFILIPKCLITRVFVNMKAAGSVFSHTFTWFVVMSSSGRLGFMRSAE